MSKRRLIGGWEVPRQDTVCTYEADIPRSHVSYTHRSTHKGTRAKRPNTQHWGYLSPSDQVVVPHRNRAGRFTDTQKYGRTTEFRPRKSTGRFMRPARSGAAPGAGGGRPTHRPRFSSARRAVITAIWPLLTSSLKFFVDFYSWSRRRRFL